MTDDGDFHTLYRSVTGTPTVMIKIVLCLSVLLTVPTFGENQDVTNLADLEPVRQHQEPLYSGQKDSIQAELSPIEVLTSQQTDEQPTSEEDKDDSNDNVLQAYNSTWRQELQERFQDKRDWSDLKIKTSGPETDLKVPNGLTDQSDDDAVKHTDIGNTVQSQTSSEGMNMSLFGPKTNQQKQSYKLAEPDSEADLNYKDNSSNDSDLLFHGILPNSQSQSVQYVAGENEEGDRAYGNPPIELESESLGVREEISYDLSSEKEDKMPTEISPPLEQTFPTLASERKRISSTNNAYTTGSTTESSTPLPVKSFNKESSLLKMMQNVKTDSPKESQVNGDDSNSGSNSKDNMNSFEIVENNGRKVLNDKNLETLDKTEDEEYELNIDKYFYQSYDEEEDDYVGGEVLVSSKDKASWVDVDPTENGAKKKWEMTKDDVAMPDESKENEKPDPGHAKFFFDQDYSYEEDDDDWFYERVDPPDITDTEDKMVPEIDPPPRPDSNSSLQSQEMKEGVVLKEDLHTKKVLPGPKRTIILYTVLVVILIACFVLFSVWKSPLKNGRPLLQPTIVRAGEDERKKRLLDHPFV